MSVLLLAKIVIVPLLVGAMSLAARRWGPAIGGLIMGLPWMTGPVLLFLAIERGEAFAARMTVGIEFGVVTIVAWVLGYTALARTARWPWCLAFAATLFAGVGIVLSRAGADAPLWVAAVAGCAALIGGVLAIPLPASPAGARALPWWDIPARMLASAALVTVIALSSEIVGPTASGIISTYPVIASVVGAFTHHQSGPAAAIRLLRSLLVSLASFAMFFVVVGVTVERFGIAASFALAAAVALTLSASTVIAARAGLVRT